MEKPIPLILHVGYPRTATTLLQTALQKHNPGIKFWGRLVEGRDADRWRPKELFSIWEWVRLGKGGVDVDKARVLVGSLLEQAREEGMVSAVISDETMSKPHRVDWHAEMVARLRSVFPDAEILLTLRNQIDALSSMYGLYISRSLGSDLPALTFSQWFFQGAGSSYVPIADRFDYAAMYRPLLEAFGKEKIHVLLFEEFKRDYNSYLTGLAKALHCLSFTMQNDMIVNSSPDLRNDPRFKRKLCSGTLAKMYDNRLLKPIHDILDKLCLSDNRIEWSQYAQDDESKRVIAHMFFESNDKFGRMSGIDLAAAGYPTLTSLRDKYIYYRQ